MAQAAIDGVREAAVVVVGGSRSVCGRCWGVLSLVDGFVLECDFGVVDDDGLFRLRLFAIVYDSVRLIEAWCGVVWCGRGVFLWFMFGVLLFFGRLVSVFLLFLDRIKMSF